MRFADPRLLPVKFYFEGWLLLLITLLFCLVCMLLSVPPVSCRLLFYGPQPKTDGRSSQKSLLFLCMTRMTPPLSAPSASRQAATSLLVFLQLPCVTFSNPPPHPPPSWLSRPRYPQTPSSRALTGTILWPLLLSLVPRCQSSLRLLLTTQPITIASRPTSPPNRSW